MDKKIKYFIEKNINLIENNEWEEIYKRLLDIQTGIFTESLLDAGIDPLEHLNYIPDFYLLNSSIEKFKIPNNIKIIGSKAFYLCSRLTSITIPDSVTNIGDSAFRDCSYLISVTIGNSLTNIGDYAFFDCSRLTSITIPDSVTSIGDDAFDDCNGLKSITIGNGVKSIGDYAFFNCYDLTSITFKGTIEQWDSISKGISWNYNVPTAVIKCKDGDKRYES